jgi:hypothetical protein
MVMVRQPLLLLLLLGLSKVLAASAPAVLLMLTVQGPQHGRQGLTSGAKS